MPNREHIVGYMARGRGNGGPEGQENVNPQTWGSEAKGFRQEKKEGGKDHISVLHGKLKQRGREGEKETRREG